MMVDVSFSPELTRDGYLPPWEMAKAHAFHVCLRQISAHLGEEPAELLGERVDAWIAKQLTLKGGGCPSDRAVRDLLKRCQDPKWYPGKLSSFSTGRPPVVTAHQKQEIARVAMDLKSNKRRMPTPALVRAKLPRVSLNRQTGQPLSDWSITGIFKTHCFDDDDDDPWQWLACPSQDYLPDSMKPLRVGCAEHILEHFRPGAWVSHIAFDPCSTLLPRTAARLEEQQVAAMGKRRWYSKGSARKGVNLRAPATAKTQAGQDVLQVHWTPIFCRGKVYIHVCVPREAAGDPQLPTKLNNSADVAKFVRHVLPKALADMKKQHGWSTVSVKS